MLIPADSGGGTHEFLDYCHRRRVQYSIGFGISDDIVAALDDSDPDEWIPALDADGHVRDEAWVTEVTGIAGLSGWPPGMRLLVRKERLHPGVQLRFTDHDGLRLTAFAHLHPRRISAGSGVAAPPPGPPRPAKTATQTPSGQPTPSRKIEADPMIEEVLVPFRKAEGVGRDMRASILDAVHS